jgi:hypothetical protein
MSNYFSQLIQQTAISVASPNHSYARPDSVANHQDTIQVIDAEAIAAQPKPLAEPSSQPVRDDLSATENLNQDFEINSEQRTLPQAIFNQKGNQKTISDNTRLETNSDFLHKEPLIQEIEQNQPSERLKPDEDHSTSPLDSVPQPISRSKKRIEKSLEPETTIEVQPANHLPPTETNLIEIRQDYLQAARDWVAEAPISIEESREVFDRAQLEVSPASWEPVKPARAQSIPLEQVYPSEPQHPEVQDWVLSIGSINVTIEAPQSELHLPSVPPAQTEPRPIPAIQPSRISRYYLR